MNAVEDRYPTRKEKEFIIPRTDPIVWGKETGHRRHPLDKEELAFYEENGYLLVPNAFSQSEVDRLLAELNRIIDANEFEGREERVMEPDSNEVRSLFSPHRFSDLFERLSKDARILDRVTRILGSDVYIHQARINIKQALHGKSFPWHSDFETWHAEDGLPHMRVLSGWITLTDNNEFNGPLYLMAGSHKQYLSCPGQTPEDNYKQSLRKQAYGTPSLEGIRKLAENATLVSVHAPPGTLVFHDGNILHGSPDNLSPWSRTNIFFVYNSVENLPGDRPFSLDGFRPEHLGSKNFAPLGSVENAFI
uniref:Ectoine hydroxylase n=1 Tax=Candidatus Kentrum eta TaxID=2126337 RepID=A0A450U7S1_9GAMM|nr:MAG: ectoine hydroxylase [Candidatus Kentron sp. H]VFJ89927.1 MAG: ectoine hydroxylase [Candidatus Kentron sp. H]VFJ96311.1 MAG: ectoine hydroxylase [Candidatus Kentron sp. H]